MGNLAYFLFWMSLGHLPMTQLVKNKTCKGMCKFIHMFFNSTASFIEIALLFDQKALNRVRFSVMKPEICGYVYCNVVRYCKSHGLFFFLQIFTHSNMLRKIIKIFIKGNGFINNILYQKRRIGISIAWKIPTWLYQNPFRFIASTELIS